MLGSSPTPGDARLRPLAASRIAFGLLFLLRTTPLLAPFDLWYLRETFPLLGWPAPGFRGHVLFTLPTLGVQTLCVLRSLAAAAFLFGYRTRMAGIVAGTAGYAVLSQEPFAFIFTLHLLYLGTILLALVDSGCEWALRKEPAKAPASSASLIRVFVASIYLWAAAYKLRPDWLDGSALELYYRDHALAGAFADALLATAPRRAIVAICVALTELALGLLLLLRRTLPAGLALAFGFHLAIQVVGAPDLLGIEMAALLIAFCPTRARA